MARSSGGTRKLLWLMMGLLILTSSVAAAALYLAFDRREVEAPSSDAAEAHAEPSSPIFLAIDPFTVNLADDDYGSRLLYAGLTLKLGDEQSRERLSEHMPEVRSRLLMLLSGKKATTLTSPGGKRQLAAEIVTALESPMGEHQPPSAIADVLFTDFIVQ